MTRYLSRFQCRVVGECVTGLFHLRNVIEFCQAENFYAVWLEKQADLFKFTSITSRNDE